MSRETDIPSSGPDGRGGAAYPSGTPPYGTPTASDDRTEAGRSAAQPEERKTETTLTTRIRINIPGSRPIPPVVVRTPVAESESTDPDPTATAPAGGAEQQSPGAPAAGSALEPYGRTAGPGDEKPSDWFAPRKAGSGKGGPGATGTNGAGIPGGSAAGGGAATGAPGAGAPRAGGSTSSGNRPGGVTGAMSLPSGSRPGGAAGAGGTSGAGGTNGAGYAGATGSGPVAPGHGGGTGSFDVTEALAAGGSRPSGGQGEPRRDELPYFSEPGHELPPGQGGFGGANGGPQGPAGPTGGPVTGDGPTVPPVGGGPSPFNDFTAGPGAGLSDDTAVLTPQKPASGGPGVPGYGGASNDNVSGHTVTSGIPVVPAAGNGPFGPGAHTDGPLPHTPPKRPEPAGRSTPAAGKKKKKGRSKLVLLGTLVILAAAGAYGAGLLMNHSDVPKGTTVLGVDIGGGTRDDAVKKLDDAFGGRVNKPLKLSVDGSTVTLKPDQAGLQFDTTATVSAAATSDYNPVSVIGSLFGGHRVVAPEMPVDEEKLQAALQSAAGGAGSVTEGSIKFESGKAVAVYGKAGKGIDAAQAAHAVEEAYRTQVETDATTPVKVPTTTRQPTVSNAEVDREMKAFAQPAMSANVTVQTDAAHSVPMSPQNSLWKFLKVTAVDGKLVDKPDLVALKNLYGQAFDGVTIARANGKKTAVTPQDVYVALRTALLSKTDRIAVIDTNPS
ncbi:hypothetical protein [Streptomyces sp. NPDC005423]|uniref:hypothetical protein n=1 Tax=Streptomyces sp. NPDC005423 TaxID=3155343 RepID=UPI0033BF9FD7